MSKRARHRAEEPMVGYGPAYTLSDALIGFVGMLAIITIMLTTR